MMMHMYDNLIHCGANVMGYGVLGKFYLSTEAATAVFLQGREAIWWKANKVFMFILPAILAKEGILFIFTKKVCEKVS